MALLRFACIACLLLLPACESDSGNSAPKSTASSSASTQPALKSPLPDRLGDAVLAMELSPTYQQSLVRRGTDEANRTFYQTEDTDTGPQKTYDGFGLPATTLMFLTENDRIAFISTKLVAETSYDNIASTLRTLTDTYGPPHQYCVKHLTMSAPDSKPQPPVPSYRWKDSDKTFEFSISPRANSGLFVAVTTAGEQQRGDGIVRERYSVKTECEPFPTSSRFPEIAGQYCIPKANPQESKRTILLLDTGRYMILKPKVEQGFVTGVLIDDSGTFERTAKQHEYKGTSTKGTQYLFGKDPTGCIVLRETAES